MSQHAVENELPHATGMLVTQPLLVAGPAKGGEPGFKGPPKGSARDVWAVEDGVVGTADLETGARGGSRVYMAAVAVQYRWHITC